MNEDEKKTAIDMLAAHIRETRPYLFQLSARHDEELGLIAALAEASLPCLSGTGNQGKCGQSTLRTIALMKW